MPDNTLLYLLPVFSAVLGALLVLIPVLFVEEVVSIVAAAAALVFSVFLLFLPDHGSVWVFVDGYSKVMLVIISFVWLTSVLYSVAYLPHVKNPLFKKRTYFFLLDAFALVLLLAVTLANLGLVWFAIEATTVTSALLVAMDGSESAVEASWRFIIIVSSGLVLALLSCIFLYASAGTLILGQLNLVHPTGPLITVAAVLAAVGFGTKAGLFPFFTWLPDVHGKAPSPVSAMFSALVLPVTIYALVRILGVAQIANVELLLFVMGVLTLGVTAFLLTVQRDLKRLFAYSTIENMAVILIGFSLGGNGAVAAVLMVVAHALSKSSAFYLCGNVLMEYDTIRINQIQGVAGRLPSTGFALFFSSLSVTGAPPFASFIAELVILATVWTHFGAFWAILLGGLLALSFLAVNSKVVSVVFSPTSHKKQKTSFLAVAVPIVNIVLGLVLVFFLPALETVLSGALGL
jgi:hydrogenase-4 component F